MDTNQLPFTDLSALEPGCCCPPFDPAAWDRLTLSFEDKPFVRVLTRNLFHIPLNMSTVFAATWDKIKAAQAETHQFAILSDDSSLWRGEHFFAVKADVPGQENVRLSGRFVTRVFEGPYRDAYVWVREMREDIALTGRRMGRLLFFYSTCPKCAERRGHNYVVAVGEVL